MNLFIKDMIVLAIIVLIFTYVLYLSFPGMP